MNWIGIRDGGFFWFCCGRDAVLIDLISKKRYELEKHRILSDNLGDCQFDKKNVDFVGRMSIYWETLNFIRRISVFIKKTSFIRRM